MIESNMESSNQPSVAPNASIKVEIADVDLSGALKQVIYQISDFPNIIESTHSKKFQQY